MIFSNWLFHTNGAAGDGFHPSNPGSGIKDIKRLVIDKDGHETLEVIGKHNLYDEIQSHKDFTDIHIIVDRFKNGDLTALNRRVGSFMDITDFPHNYAEMLQSFIDARKVFDELPADKRSKFGDFDTFLSTFGTKDWISVFQDPDIKQAVDVVVESEVKIDE